MRGGRVVIRRRRRNRRQADERNLAIARDVPQPQVAADHAPCVRPAGRWHERARVTGAGKNLGREDPVHCGDNGKPDRRRGRYPESAAISEKAVGQPWSTGHGPSPVSSQRKYASLCSAVNSTSPEGSSKSFMSLGCGTKCLARAQRSIACRSHSRSAASAVAAYALTPRMSGTSQTQRSGPSCRRSARYSRHSFTTTDAWRASGCPVLGALDMLKVYAVCRRPTSCARSRQPPGRIARWSTLVSGGQLSYFGRRDRD